MDDASELKFTGERIVPEADNCEPHFALKMYQEHIARYMFSAQLCKGKTVIDIGCGVGYGSRYLAENGAKSIFSFDISEDSIEHARKYYNHPAITFEVESVHNFVPPEAADVIVCFELIEHVEHQAQAIRRMSRYLKPEGILVISTPRALEQKRTHFHTHEFELGEFEDMLLANFATVDMWFENNHFSTIVAAKEPRSLSRIENINNGFSLKTADYFIAVARKSAGTTLPDLEDILIVSDEAYVKLLERDIGILRKAEDDLLGRHADLEQAHSRAVERELQLSSEIADLQAALSAKKAEFGAALSAKDSQFAAALSAKDSQFAAALSARDSEFEAALSFKESEFAAALSAEAEQAQAKRDLLVAEHATRIEDYVRQLAAGNAAIETATNQVAALQEARSQAEVDLRIMAGELEQALHDRELWRVRVQDLEHAILALRRSTSWILTWPLRTLKRGPRALLRRSWALIRFTAHNGVGATARLVRRKLAYEPSPAAARSALAVVESPAEHRAPTVVAPLAAVIEQPPEQALANGETFDVVFFIGCWDGESKRYRVYNVADALAAKGFKVKVLGDWQCHEMVVQGWLARRIVFFRSAYQERFKIAETIEYAHSIGAKVVFDVDDLVFDPSLFNQIHGISSFSRDEKEHYLDGLMQYRRLLRMCDFATVSTAPLARAVEHLGVPARVVPNSLNAEQIAAADAIIAGKASGGRMTIGYFSGSRTHERDFAQAEGAIMELMRERDDFDLLVVGYLQLGEHWNGLDSRVRRQDFMPALDMLAELGACDIAIAPLEVGDQFCEAKSELKFFEAALVETPTVASSTEPFRRAIEDGSTGFLATEPGQWKAALSRLLDDPDLRRTIGHKARAAALEQFGVEAVGRIAIDALFGSNGRKRSEASAEDNWSAAPRLKIDWIIPRLIIGGGGHRNILRAAHHLQLFGHDVALHFTNSDDQASELAGLIAQHFYPFTGSVKAYDGQFRESDVILATHWTTVDAALRAKSKTRELMYFVQDFEPAFAPMGSEYVLAENTYRQGLYCITSGPWCERLLKAEYAAEADHFRFPVDHEVYAPQPRTKTNPNVIFFAKPDMPRRCFEIGSMALAHFHRRRPDVELILFGSGEIRNRTLDFPATLLEVVPTIHDLAAMYANADLGLVFSTTNPSLVPYEMMASGCPVVDLDRPGNEYNYNDRRDIAFLADPIPEKMAAQIAELMDQPAERARRRAEGLAFAASFPTEDQMARRVEHLIMSRMRVREHI